MDWKIILDFSSTWDFACILYPWPGSSITPCMESYEIHPSLDALINSCIRVFWMWVAEGKDEATFRWNIKNIDFIKYFKFIIRSANTTIKSPRCIVD